jgi:hypothetical protein
MTTALTSEHRNLKCSHFVGIGVAVCRIIPCSAVVTTLRVKYSPTFGLLSNRH